MTLHTQWLRSEPGIVVVVDEQDQFNKFRTENAYALNWCQRLALAGHKLLFPKSDISTVRRFMQHAIGDLNSRRYIFPQHILDIDLLC